MKLTRSRLIGLVGAAVLGILLGTLADNVLQRYAGANNAETAPIGRRPNIGGAFSLVDHNGARVTEKSYTGKALLVFFGFMNCPDVCPTALSAVSAILDEIGEKAREVQPLFITVDPERDSVALLASYVSHFHPSIVGLTGTAEEIATVARTYRVFYQRVPGSAPDVYSMDHSASVYLMNRQGRFHGTLDLHEGADVRTEKVLRLLRDTGQDDE